jgi:hypothetical protein
MADYPIQYCASRRTNPEWRTIGRWPGSMYATRTVRRCASVTTADVTRDLGGSSAASRHDQRHGLAVQICFTKSLGSGGVRIAWLASAPAPTQPAQ